MCYTERNAKGATRSTFRDDGSPSRPQMRLESQIRRYGVAAWCGCDFLLPGAGSGTTVPCPCVEFPRGGLVSILYDFERLLSDMIVAIAIDRIRSIQAPGVLAWLEDLLYLPELLYTLIEPSLAKEMKHESNCSLPIWWTGSTEV